VNASADALAPLTVAQQATSQALDHREAPGVATLTLAIDGAIDERAIAAAIGTVARRHPMLRATITTIDGRPMLHFAAEADLRSLVATIQAAEEIANVATSRPFDLHSEPGWRIALLRQSPVQAQVTIVLHPFAGDARSLAVIGDELARALVGEALPASGPDYGEFARWQRRWLVGDDAEQELARRAGEVAGNPPLELNRHRRASGEPAAGAAGLRVGCTLALDAQGELRKLAADHGLAIDVALVALFGGLASRVTGQSAFALPLARDRAVLPAWAGVVGPASEEIALAIDVDDDPTLRQLFARVAEAAKRASGQAPLARVLERALPEARHASVRVVVVPECARREGGGIVVTPGRLTIPATRSIDLVATIGDSALALELVHDGRDLDRAQLAALAEQFVGFTAQAIAAPDRPLGAHSLVTLGTRSLLSDPTAPITRAAQRPFVTAIVAWAAVRPELPAVTQGDRRVSYGQLEQASRRIAIALRAAGVERGAVVAVVGEGCPGYIVAMVGVLRSGAVLLSIDPRMSATRCNLMLREARAVAVIQAGEAVDIDAPALRFALRTADGALEGEIDESASLPVIDEHDHAYVVFTSGTTGVPKAALWTHGSVAHFLDWQCATFALGPTDRAAQLVNLSFAVSTREVFTPLVAGAELLLPPRDWLQMGAAYLMAWIAEQRITMLQGVPSLLRTWLAAAPPDVEFAVRYVFVSSEPLAATIVTAIRSAFGNACRVVNLFGATESCQAKIFYEVPQAISSGLLPIGRGIPGAQALIVNRAGLQAGVGEPGQMMVRSPYLALGYINAQGDSGFRRNPFRDDERDRVYVSGDVGYVEVDGTVTICGRVDDQLKIRGVRVEPAEVAAVICTHPNVADAVVSVRGEGDERSLAAYVVARRLAPPARELRAWIANRLVAAMVPASITFLDRLPLNANGKVDRLALPAPNETVEHVPPRNELELSLLAIWGSVLARADLGVNDDFFANGAIQSRRRVRWCAPAMSSGSRSP
jgi:amino acid adenylation domain-containing protein